MKRELPAWYTEGIRAFQNFAYDRNSRAGHDEKVRLLGNIPCPTRAEWHDFDEDLRREYNRIVHGISTSCVIRILPFVPSAVRDLPLRLFPVLA
jgi:hypothetical protein